MGIKKNRLLNISFYGCKIAQIICVISVLLLTTAFIHFQLDREYYKELDITYNKSDFLYSKVDTWNSEIKATNINTNFIIDTISNLSLCLIYIKYLLVFILVFCALNEFKKIILSVKNSSTFQLINVSGFRRIGNFLFLYFILTSFNWIEFQNGTLMTFNLSIAPIALMTSAFILSEIFKEGNRLKQENDLTI